MKNEEYGISSSKRFCVLLVTREHGAFLGRSLVTFVTLYSYEPYRAFSIHGAYRTHVCRRAKKRWCGGRIYAVPGGAVDGVTNHQPWMSLRTASIWWRLHGSCSIPRIQAIPAGAIEVDLAGRRHTPIATRRQQGTIAVVAGILLPREGWTLNYLPASFFALVSATTSRPPLRILLPLQREVVAAQGQRTHSV